MIEYNLLLAYIASVFLLIATPGPVVALVIRNATRAGFKAALATSIGTNAASLVLILFSIAIILGIFHLSSSFLNILSLFGCVFIFYLGFSSFFQSLKAVHNAMNVESQSSVDSKPLISYFTQGFSIAISNPKDILFFVAFFPQFIHVAQSLPLSFSLLVSLWILLDFSILLSYSLLMQKAIFLRFQKGIALLSDITLMLIGIIGGVMLGIKQFGG